MTVHADNVFFKLFANAADSDSPEMNVDGDPTPVNFDVSVPADELNPVTIRRVCLVGLDGGITPSEFFGIAELTNGLTIKIIDADGATLVDFLDGLTIKKNNDWVLLAGIDNPILNAAGLDEFAVRWTLSNGLSEPLTLKPGQKMRVVVADDLTGVSEFRMMAQGTR